MVRTSTTAWFYLREFRITGRRVQSAHGLGATWKDVNRWYRIVPGFAEEYDQLDKQWNTKQRKAAL